MNTYSYLELTSEVLCAAVEDCKRLGANRRKQLEHGRDWSKFSNCRGSVRRMLLWLHSDQFENMAAALNQDCRRLRGEMIRFMAGYALSGDE